MSGEDIRSLGDTIASLERRIAELEARGVEPFRSCADGALEESQPDPWSKLSRRGLIKATALGAAAVAGLGVFREAEARSAPGSVPLETLRSASRFEFEAADIKVEHHRIRGNCDGNEQANSNFFAGGYREGMCQDNVLPGFFTDALGWKTGLQYGVAAAGIMAGVYGESIPSDALALPSVTVPAGTGVMGAGYNYGVYGWADNTGSTGVYGQGDSSGVFGYSQSGNGVVGSLTGDEPGGVAAVYADGGKVGPGTWATSSASYGVYGESDSTYGIYGASHASDGIHGTTSHSGYAGVAGSVDDPASSGVWGDNAGSGPGAKGTSGSGHGVEGSSGGSYGVYGHSSGSDGIHGTTTQSGNAGVGGSVNDPKSSGVWGNNDGSGPGAKGTSGSGDGVYGFSKSGYGIRGQSTHADGVYGTGESSGVTGESLKGYGVYGSGAYGAWGYSKGGTGVVGTLTGDFPTATCAVYADGGSAGDGLVATSSGVGVDASSTGSDGVRGSTSGTNKAGLAGTGAGPGCAGVYGNGTAAGAFGYSETGIGVWGSLTGATTSSIRAAVYGDGGSADHGVLGATEGGTGVRGTAGTGDGVSGSSSSGRGGVFTGGAAQIALTPAPTTGAPTMDPHKAGDLFLDTDANLYICTKSGSPGTWVRVMTEAA